MGMDKLVGWSGCTKTRRTMVVWKWFIHLDIEGPGDPYTERFQDSINTRE